MNAYRLMPCAFLSLLLIVSCGSEPLKESSPVVDTTLQSTQSPAVNIAYRLEEGDRVSIVVFGEQELTLDVVLNETGTFTYPYLGEITALNKTASQLQSILTQGLSQGYLVDPKVSVTVESFREIYVGGEVEQGGSFTFQPGLTVGKAVVLAGGFTERAARNRIYVVSEGAQSTAPVRVSLDYVIKPGDVITVRRRFF